MFSLIWPSMAALPSYKAALLRKWSPNNLRADFWRDELAKIEADGPAFVAGLVDWEAAGGDIPLPDGTTVARIPGYRRWVVQGDAAAPEFVGTIGFRRVLGSNELPAHVLGHIGYAVVPWHAGKGAATFALRELIEAALADGHLDGMDYVEVTTQPDNVASQRVIAKCGGVLLGTYTEYAGYGSNEGLKYRIPLTARA